MFKLKMLIVDDNIFNRQVLNELFDAEFNVLQAGDGMEALALLREHAGTLAVMLLDIIMPKKDGLDVLREMQQDEQLKDIPVIVTSSVGDESFRMKAFELGAIDYIATPFNPMLAKLRVKSALATKEYDRLRLQNETLNVRQKEEAGYRAILECTNTAVLEFNGKGEIISYDATIKKELAGTYDKRQLLDIFREDGVAEPEALAGLQQLFNRVLTDASLTSDQIDMQLCKADGSHSWFRLLLLKKTDYATGDSRLIMSITNIDQQKCEEEATRTQLIRALHAAENASTAKSEFVSRMSHELRTPLNSIIGFINLAQNNIEDTRLVREYLTKTETASKQLLAIINDVLDMSAIEAGHMTISYESYNLKELINAITSIVYPPIHKKSIRFQIMLDSISNENVMGDKLRVSQILLNLLSNAVKFTPYNGEIILKIKQRPLNANRLLMDFVVQDTGVGMSREFLQRLGQPFEQQNQFVLGHRSGSGLGLSITKKLVALMNGALTIDSIEGRGSTFTVSLPMDIEQTEPATKKYYNFTDIRVLVIDRDETAAGHTRACFRDLGCLCDCVTSGKEALDLCQTNNYKLVLLDWILPDFSGQSLIDAIRQSTDGEPQIVIMAYDYSEISKEAISDLVFIHKPIFQSTILDLMLQLYGKYEAKTAEHELPDFSGKRVLLVEDKAMNLEIASGILKAMGFAVVTALNGREACETFINSAPGEFDLILMDLQMPVMDGYEATRCIRESQHYAAQSIPIIAMSADTFTKDVTAALDCGMNGHIAKPIDIELMSKTIATYVL